jgi:hypothetical protein
MVRVRRYALAAAFVLVATFVGCSLDLDESLIARRASVAPDGGDAAADAADAAILDSSVAAPPCTKDEDCTTTHGCLTARCDLTRNRCVYPVCRSGECSTGACEGTVCGAPAQYNYRAAEFPVGAGIGCGGQGSRCLAAAYPFLFVGTTNGVVVFDVSNPQNPDPRRVPLVGLGFVPTQLTASGGRVFFVGAPVGAGSGARIPIAYVDVPADPFVEVVRAVTVLGSYERPASEGVAVYPRAEDTAMFVNGTQAASFPTGILKPPLVEPFAIELTPLPSTMTPVTTSGTRLVVATTTPSGVASFALVANAGEDNPLAGNASGVEGTTPVGSPSHIATSARGTVAWLVPNLLSPPDFDGGPVNVRAVRAVFLVADGQAGITSVGLDVAVYTGLAADIANGTPLAGAVAIVDTNTALVATAVPTAINQTHVQFVRRDPLAVVTNEPVNTDVRRFTIPLPPNEVFATAANGIGYVLAVDADKPTEAKVYAFDPACPVP